MRKELKVAKLIRKIKKHQEVTKPPTCLDIAILRNIGDKDEYL